MEPRFTRGEYWLLETVVNFCAICYTLFQTKITFPNKDNRGNRMCRVSVFFMATLLLFSAVPTGFAQQNTVRAQAEADASADMSDESKVD